MRLATKLRLSCAGLVVIGLAMLCFHHLVIVPEGRVYGARTITLCGLIALCVWGIVFPADMLPADWEDRPLWRWLGMLALFLVGCGAGAWLVFGLYGVRFGEI